MITAYLINSEKSLAGLFRDLTDVAGPFIKAETAVGKIVADDMVLERVNIKESVIICDKEVKTYDSIVRYTGPMEYLNCFGEPELTFIVNDIDPFEEN